MWNISEIRQKAEFSNMLMRNISWILWNRSSSCGHRTAQNILNMLDNNIHCNFIICTTRYNNIGVPFRRPCEVLEGTFDECGVLIQRSTVSRSTRRASRVCRSPCPQRSSCRGGPVCLCCTGRECLEKLELINKNI